MNGGSLLHNISYNGAGQLTGWNWKNSNRQYLVDYDANATGKIHSIRNTNSVGAVGYGVTYLYDDDRIRDIDRQNGRDERFKYDNVGRLTEETRYSGNSQLYKINYTYDSNGNRKTLRTSGSHKQPLYTVDYHYSSNKLTKMNNISLMYTANAELRDSYLNRFNIIMSFVYERDSSIFD